MATNYDEIAKKYGGTPTDAQSTTPTAPAKPQPTGATGLKGFGIGALKGLGSSVKGGLNLVGKGLDSVGGLVDKAMGVKTPVGPKVTDSVNWAIPEKVITPTNPTQRAGFVTEQIAEFAVPGSYATKAGKAVQAVSGASKAGRILGFAGRAGVEGLVSGGVTAAQGGDVKLGTAFGAAGPVVAKTVGGLGTVGKNVAKFMSSKLSGVPEAAIEEAFRNPKLVQQAILKAAQAGEEETAQSILKKTFNALDQLKEERATFFKQGLETIENELRIKGQQVPTSLMGLKTVTTQTLRNFGLSAKGKMIDINQASLTKSHVNKLSELVDRIYTWNDAGPLGLEKLKRVINSYNIKGVNPSSADKQFDKIILTLGNNLGSYVGRRNPAIAELRKTYALQSQVIDDVVTQLKTNSKDPNTALRKLVNVFNPANKVYRPIVRELGDKAGIDLMSDIAGLTMSQWSSQGLSAHFASLLFGAGGAASIFNPALAVPTAATVAASSPRLIGKFVTTAGKVAPKAKTAVRRFGQGIKGAVTQHFTDQ